MSTERIDDRSLLRVTGPERQDFLQGLVTNDVRRLRDGMVYAAMLSPQGKYLADFFLVPRGETILIDVHSGLAEMLLRRLTMYRLRAKVEIAPHDGAVLRGTGTPPAGAFADPRHEAMGWRLYLDGAGDGAGGATETEAHAADRPDWDALRVAHCIPESLIELQPDESYILEAGFERLSGVDFRKGCYVGQEVTARMKHKTELRKGLRRLRIEGAAPVGTAITAGDRAVGTLFTRAGNEALAHVRFDRLAPRMEAGPARLSPIDD